MKTSTSALLRYIRNHGMIADIDASSGRILAWAPYGGRRPFWRLESIKPTLKAVRDWLGY